MLADAPFGSPVARMVACAKCGTDVECSEYTWQLAAVFNRALRARGEKSLRSSELALCRACTGRWREAQRKWSLECAEACKATFDAYKAGRVKREQLPSALAKDPSFIDRLNRYDALAAGGGRKKGVDY